METEINIEDTLIFSETSLLDLPSAKFHVNSWVFKDDFMFYCAGIFAATLSNLSKGGYLKIEIERSPIKFFGISLFTRHKYLIQLLKKNPKNSIIGWLEEWIFKCLQFNQFQYLDNLAYEVFNEIYKEDKKLINPGKVFFVELLKNQRIGIFEFQENKNWLINSITVWQTKKTKQIPKSFTISNILSFLTDPQVKKLRSVIQIQLRKFQQLDT